MLMRGNRWLGIFNGVSAFNNSGMSLLDANMVCPPISIGEAEG
jgi:Trk-type K+ transport system membrane component